MPLREEQLVDVASCFKLAYSRKSSADAFSSAKAFDVDEQLEAALTWAQMPEHHLLTPTSPCYPAQLHHLQNPPAILFARGKLDCLTRPSIAVVGSRNASPQGLKIAHAFSNVLSLSGLTIISGLALGIDTAAHGGALASVNGNNTVAVIGNGVDIAYPKSNGILADRIAERGCILSEFPLGAPPLASHFPKRNRLIAALSNGIWVVEAALKSGSLITAKIGIELGKNVFATPGSIFSQQSKGCHWLIQQGAKLVDSPECILEEMGEKYASQSLNFGDLITPNAQQTIFDVDPLLNSMSWTPWWPDELALHLQLNAGKTTSLLLQWEFEGKVKRQGDGRYCRI
jgi:DNA processing protein